MDKEKIPSFCDLALDIYFFCLASVFAHCMCRCPFHFSFSKAQTSCLHVNNMLSGFRKLKRRRVGFAKGKQGRRNITRPMGPLKFILSKIASVKKWQLYAQIQSPWAPNVLKLVSEILICIRCGWVITDFDWEAKSRFNF